MTGQDHIVTFDTLSYAKRLRSAGFTEAQAEVQAHGLLEVLETQLASKSDVRELTTGQGKLKTGMVQLKERMDDLEKEMGKLKERMDKLEGRMDKLEERMDKLEERMDRLEQRMDKLEERMDRLEQRIDKLEARVEQLGLQLTVRMGGMITAAVVVLGVLGHFQ